MRSEMEAALFFGDKEDMRLESIDIPEIGDGDVLLKVNACGICGSDARYYFNGNEPRYKKPVILGHELTARVHKIGRNVKNYKIGDRIAVAPIYGCGQCEFCLSGYENLCEEVVIFGINIDGGFAEFMKIPQQGVKRGVLLKIDESISDEAGTMLESLSCVLHGQRKLNLQPGDSVIIFGAGPIGIFHLLVSKKIGAGKIGIIDFIPERLKEALKFGADFVIDGNSSGWAAEVFKFIGKNGADHAVTAAPSLSAVENSLKIIKTGGNILIFGGMPKNNYLTVDPNMIHYREIKVLGSVDASLDDFKRAALLAPFFDLERFVSYKYRLGDIKLGMDRLKNKQGLKTICVL
jgi:L-iditol 2-dehydrogenase